MKAERATVAEQVGRAVNSSHLEHRLGRNTAVVTIGAVGAAALHIHHGADLKRIPVASLIGDQQHAPDPQDVIAAQLVVSLRHIVEAGQAGEVPRAVQLFTAWMGYRSRFDVIEDRSILLPKLAERAIHEMLSDKCIACGGSGKLERSRTGSWVRPRGSMQRNATFRTCTACEGSRRQAISHTQRRVALGMTRERYDNERWDAHFGAALTWLTRRLSPRLNRPLTVQLERSKKRV